jgi:hypothetical protein
VCFPDPIARQQLLNQFRFVQQVYQSFDRSARAPSVTAGDLLEAEVAGRLRQPLVAGRLLDNVGIAANFVFGYDAGGRLGVGHLLADTLDAFPSELFGGSQACHLPKSCRKDWTMAQGRASEGGNVPRFRSVRRAACVAQNPH